jgi:hypothetical protein
VQETTFTLFTEKGYTADPFDYTCFSCMLFLLILQRTHAFTNYI